MNKEDFKELDREQMIIAFNQLKDDYSSLFNELEQEKEKNTDLRIQISAREQVCEDLQKQLNGAFDRGFISKDKIKDFASEKMKHLYVDSCAEDSGKYTAYKNILNLLEEE